MTLKDSKKVIDYMMGLKRAGNMISHWKVTEKNLIMFDLDDNRTMIPLKNILDGEYEDRK